ncbi:hypothetical protein [Corynebacterium aquilae]|uniref:Uncharacterized protein n=1 Tax=Corynebacterium aquilae DSM 44791 TaxID=1431546 RepID=A0A1L7CD72_9CORY|nr:hypothetical protein [Corynebacterium aquilae]APT83786.1 hypothetical protein CAQU_00305 [Corynebacterium aquilae DSM 44791]
MSDDATTAHPSGLDAHPWWFTLATQGLLLIILIATVVEAILLAGWVLDPDAMWWQIVILPQTWLLSGQADVWAAIFYSVAHNIIGTSMRYSSVIQVTFAVILTVKFLLLVYAGWGRGNSVLMSALKLLLILQALANTYIVFIQNFAIPAVGLLFGAGINLAFVWFVHEAGKTPRAAEL